MKALASTFVSGFLIALGLGVSGMTRPTKIIDFLDFTGAWDPSLLFVIGGAVVTYGLVFRLTRRAPRPVWESTFQIPTRKELDARLVVGASLFGLGWGVAGFCPGPAVAALASGAPPVFVFLSAMVAGMTSFNLFDHWSKKRRSREQPSVAVGAPEKASA